jgi:hypothetical protein
MKRLRESDDDSVGSRSESQQDRSEDEEDDNSGYSSEFSKMIKSQLQATLNTLSFALTYASSGSCPVAENPGIFIPELGVLGLPLSERDAELISKRAHAAPYGKGSDTIVDTTVRKTQELNADEFELRNPKWATALEAILKQVAKDLMVPRVSQVGAVLHKMLLYSEEAMFKEHRESVSLLL